MNKIFDSHIVGFELSVREAAREVAGPEFELDVFPGEFQFL